MFHHHSGTRPFQLGPGAIAAEHTGAGGAGRDRRTDVHGGIAHHQTAFDREIQLLRGKAHRFRVRLEPAGRSAADDEFEYALQPMLSDKGLGLDFASGSDHPQPVAAFESGEHLHHSGDDVKIVPAGPFYAPEALPEIEQGFVDPEPVQKGDQAIDRRFQQHDQSPGFHLGLGQTQPCHPAAHPRGQLVIGIHQGAVEIKEHRSDLIGERDPGRGALTRGEGRMAGLLLAIQIMARGHSAISFAS
jgi:hypothetical protein